MMIDEVAERLGISSEAARAVVKAALVSARDEEADKRNRHTGGGMK